MRDLFLALMFYTRIPTPPVKDYKAEDANHTLRCYSLIGWIIGVICALAFIAGQFLGVPIGVVLSLAAGVAATGFFHEDGFADMVDGFGGGTSKQKVLDIMKDSRIGSFGTIALILLMALKIFALIELLSGIQLESGWWMILLIYASYHSIARGVSGNMVFISRYSRDDGTSKVKPVEKACGARELAGLWGFALVPYALCIIVNPWYALLPVLPVAALFFFKHICEKRIDGYTGDCMGALEQVNEVLILLSFVLITSCVA